MERNIDSMGRIVIPSEYRKQLHIGDKDLLNMDVLDNKIVISKANPKPTDVRREKILLYNEKKIKELREKYPQGMILECIEMNDPYSPVPTGVKGVVTLVDDVGSIHVSWENGQTLALLEDEDRFKIVK
ncbi:MAG: DUF4314 domain-containing protein [Bacilli bacterium]|nr:DUF4314 domain-containing protein [Bacilli bacterium]